MKSINLTVTFFEVTDTFLCVNVRTKHSWDSNDILIE